MSVRRLLVVGFGSAAFLGCTEPRNTNPASFNGAFVLQSANGRAVPFVQFSTPKYQLTQLADTIFADGRGRYVHRYVWQLDSLGNGFRRTQTSDESNYYMIGRDSVYFSISCGPNENCAPPPLGVLQRNGNLRLVPSVPWDTYTAQYIRLR